MFELQTSPPLKEIDQSPRDFVESPDVAGWCDTWDVPPLTHELNDRSWIFPEVKMVKYITAVNVKPGLPNPKVSY